MINFLTNIIGFATILYAPILVWYKPNFSAFDYLLITLTGMFLIMFKGDSAKLVILQIINTITNQQNQPK